MAGQGALCILMIDNVLDETMISDLLAADTFRRREQDDLTDRIKVDVHGDELGRAFQLTILSDEIRQKARDFHDHAWRAWYDRQTRSFEAAVSRYPPGQGMTWHCDHQMHGRILNFVIPLNDFADGALSLSREPWIDQEVDCLEPELVVPCARNRMIMFPAWYAHQAEPAASERIVCHGHVSMYPPGI